MLAYDMSERGEFSRYEYLYRCIRDDIATGSIAPGDRLPSKRELARRLGVSLITVESAYAQLIAEGYVIARQRRGYYAAELPDAYSPLQASALSNLEPRVAESREPDPPANTVLADFSQPTTQERSPAAALWGRALRNALAHEPEGELFGSQPAQGNLRLRRAIAAHLHESRGMTVDAGNVVIGAGAQVLYVLIAQLLGRGRTIAVEDPGYPKLASIYSACGAPVRFIPLDHDGMDARTLRGSDAVIAHIMPSHQFPTGRVTSIARRYELLSWASQAPDRFIVEDDYDREFRLSGMPIPPLASIDAQGRVIYVSTFSKSLSSALRMAYMVLPAQLARAFEGSLGFYASTVSTIDQVTLARLFESGEYERHLNRYRKQQRDLRDALIKAIRTSGFGSIARIEEADSGLHFVLALETSRSEEDVAGRAAADGVVLAPLSRYLHDTANARADGGMRRFVMQYEGVERNSIPQVVEAIGRALR